MSDTKAEKSLNYLSLFYKELSASYFAENMISGSSVLDCGTGSGGLAIQLSRLGFDVEAIDQDRERMQPLLNTGVKIHVGSVLDMPFDNDSYDYVVCRSLLPYIKEWKLAVEEMRRVAKIGVLFHHNTGEFLKTPRLKGAAIYTATYEDIAEFAGLVRVIPLLSLQLNDYVEQVNDILASRENYKLVMEYERSVISKLPMPFAAKVIVVLNK